MWGWVRCVTLMQLSDKALREARERFRSLLEKTDTQEAEWQQLFADCPIIFSSSLPVRIHETDIVPLARPGRRESDFVFFPNRADPLSPFGVIELKRPDTRLIRIPRRDVLSLSADAGAAIAQAQKYALEVKAEVVVRPDQLLAIGNEIHVFVIAGLSGELAAKITNELLRAQFANLLPRNCRIIPFDTLLAAFESRFTPAVHLLNTWLPHSHATLTSLLREIETAYENWVKGPHLNEGSLEAWAKLEEEYIWLLGPSPTRKRVIPSRREFEIRGSERDSAGRRPLALEAPGPFIFAVGVCTLTADIIRGAERLGVRSPLPGGVKELVQRTGLTPSN